MNPLLSRDFQIPFDQIEPKHVVPGIREALSRAESELEAIKTAEGKRTYANTIAALDQLEERVGRVGTLAYHLISVSNSPELRDAFNTVLPEFSGFFAKLPLDDGLWQAVKSFSETPEARALTGVKRRHLDKVVREFKRSGADLPPEKKNRVLAISVELSQLGSRFSENVLDSTNAFELVLTDEADLAGLPESARSQAAQSAKSKGLDGWRFTLQLPSYQPFMQYADNRNLRRNMYQAFMNIATEGEHDNKPVIEKILNLRREVAGLLGYDNFADYRLEENMISTGAEAWAFEQGLTERTIPFWTAEMAELTDYAAHELGMEPLQPWDFAYATEKLRKAKFDLDEEELRSYFPADKVLSGLFEISRRLFGVVITERTNPAVWHPDVLYYDIHDECGSYLGSFYADWYPRESKRGGAWMNHFITGEPNSDGGFLPHLGTVCGNFSPPQGGKAALLTHREVETTFHEFGHLLHHLMSRVEVPARAGVNVAHDFVELPSQIMENWTWEREALDLFARHVDTGEPIPDTLFQKMQAARKFMQANAQMRQLSFGTVDLALHYLYDPQKDGDVTTYAQSIMAPFYLRPEFAKNGFINGFSHIFAGGYSAGYYSYKWSEVLEADAFTRFREEGIFNRDTGRDYVAAILSRGDSADPSELFRQFMGRDPSLDALLERNLDAHAAKGNA
ncbi:MAG TPA: M3 family metallopeptidase [Trueperaceae bacterium]